MKVILKQDVYKHGVAGEVVNVSDGYARNYLIPQGLAIKATPGNMRQAESLRKEAAARRARLFNELKGVAEQIEGLELRFAVKAGETGKLYGSVTMQDIADKISEELGIEVERRRVGEQNSLRELGVHSVPVRLAAHLAPRVKVVVHREGESPEGVVAAAEAAEAAEAIAEEAAEAVAEAAAVVEEADVMAPDDGGSAAPEELAAVDETGADDGA
ncbi:MAG: hypothetical protein Kow00120_25680 [Anaerolineae bacterium]